MANSYSLFIVCETLTCQGCHYNLAISINKAEKMRGCMMQVRKESDIIEKTSKSEEDEAIERAFVQMELIYKSRCVQAPGGSNVTVREIQKDE